MVIILFILALSLFSNAYLVYKLKRKPNKTNSRDATELLHDLTRGKGLVEVRVVDPDAIFMRSPRDFN